MFTTRPEIQGTFGAVTSTHWLASASGMAVLEKGGNAFDAAVAAGFVLQVVEPHLNGPAGEVPILIYNAREGRVRVICGQGTAPEAATIQAYRDQGLSLVPGTGLLAAVVPGAFDAWLTMLRDHGTMERADVLEPAIFYASGGHPMLAAAGAGPWPSITSTAPSPAGATRIGTSPPGPFRCGSTTWSTKPAVTAASKALPPRSSTAIPAAEASQWVEETMPKVPRSSGRVANTPQAYPRPTGPPGSPVRAVDSLEHRPTRWATVPLRGPDSRERGSRAPIRLRADSREWGSGAPIRSRAGSWRRVAARLFGCGFRRAAPIIGGSHSRTKDPVPCCASST